MTQATPDVLAVNSGDYELLRGIAGEAARTPEVFMEEGLMIVLAAVERVCANREASKLQTHLFIGSLEAGLEEADDLEDILRDSDGADAAAPDLGVADPFGGDEEIDVDLPSELLEKVADASGYLGVSREALVKIGVDLRYLLHVADLNGEIVALETPDPEEFDMLPSVFTD